MLQSSTLLKATKVSRDPIALDVFCDWLEASLLFGDEATLSLPEVVEFLVEESLCASQTEGWRVVNDAKLHLRKRNKLLGQGYPVVIGDTQLRRVSTWNSVPAYSFCLLISLRRIYPGWFDQHFGSDFTEQGQLFELLTELSLKHVLDGWQIHLTGWSRTTPVTITKVVETIVELLGEPAGDISRWIRTSAKDGGLDILCYRDFVDGRGGIPIFLVQCASGMDWESKLTSPNLDVWRNLVQFSALPRRAFSTPLSFVDDEFSMHANRVQGLVLDRYRLLEPLRSSRPWMTRAFSRQLNRWTKTRAMDLPWN